MMVSSHFAQAGEKNASFPVARESLPPAAGGEALPNKLIREVTFSLPTRVELIMEGLIDEQDCQCASFGNWAAEQSDADLLGWGDDFLNPDYARNVYEYIMVLRRREAWAHVLLLHDGNMFSIKMSFQNPVNPDVQIANVLKAEAIRLLTQCAQNNVNNAMYVRACGHLIAYACFGRQIFNMPTVRGILELAPFLNIVIDSRALAANIPVGQWNDQQRNLTLGGVMTDLRANDAVAAIEGTLGGGGNIPAHLALGEHRGRLLVRILRGGQNYVDGMVNTLQNIV